MDVSENVYWDWCIRGIGGIVVIAKRLADNGPRISAEHFLQLEDALGELDAVLTKLDTRRVDRGVPLVEQTNVEPVETDPGPECL